MRPRALLFALAVAALALSSMAAGDPAQETPDPAQVEAEVARAIKNPCENCGTKVLSASFCGEAEKAKREIHDMATRGMTKEQIIADFVDRYGVQILAKPEERGFNLVVYWLPSAVLLLGGVVVGLFVNRAVKRGRQSVPAKSSAPVAEAEHSDAADEYEERLRRELESLGG